jgi:hypothetical protein
MPDPASNEPWYASDAERARAEAAARAQSIRRKFVVGILIVIAVVALGTIAAQYLPRFDFEWGDKRVQQVPDAPSFCAMIEADLDGNGVADCIAINLAQQPRAVAVGFLRKSEPSIYREYRRVAPSPSDPLLYRDELAKIHALAAQFPKPPAPLPPDTDTTTIIHVIRADLDGDGEDDFILFTEAARDAHPFVMLKRDGQFVTYESLLSEAKLTTRQVAVIDENQYRIIKAMPPNTLPPPPRRTR